MRDSLLNESLFFDLDHARGAILKHARLQHHRPRSSLGRRTRANFADTRRTGEDAAPFGGSAPSLVAEDALYHVSPTPSSNRCWMISVADHKRRSKPVGIVVPSFRKANSTETVSSSGQPAICMAEWQANSDRNLVPKYLVEHPRPSAFV